MNPAEDDTLEEMEALRSAGQSASWDNTADSSNDFFLLSANLGAGHQHGSAAGAGMGAASRQDINSLHSNLFKGYSIQSLEQQHPQRHAPVQPQRSNNNAADLASLLSRFESSSVADSLVSGAPLSTLNDYDEFDASSVLKMVDDLDEEDLEEVAAAKSAASAWGAPTRSADAYGIGVNQQQQRIPQPSSSSLPAPSTPAKIMSVEEIEAKLKGHAAASPAQPMTTPTKDPALANLPEALHSLVLSGQTSQQSPSGYQGPPLPHFQHGSPAPQGLSVDENDRQHFYIPLPRSNHGLGFMTKSEIALVFRIQLSQLQSDDLNDPLKGDFYYQVMQARKGGKVNSSGQAILPVFKSGQQRNEDGSPKLPEGTLGRISAFSIHKPKKLMALGGGDDSTAEDADAQPRKTNMFAGRTLNYLIEEGYRCLMDLEDVDALLASLAPQRFEDPVRAYDRQRLVAQRADLCSRLLESLDLDEVHARMNEVAAGEHLIFKFYAIPKGRLLLYRSLVLLNPPLTYQLVDVLMHDLAQISMPAVPAPSTDEKLVLLISDLIYSMPLLPYANEIFSYFLTPKHAPRLLELVRTHMLCSYLQVLFKKGHEALMILQQNPHVPPGMPGMPGIRETVQQWRAIFDGICNSLQGNIAKLFEGLPKDAKPTLPPTQSQIAARNRREKEKEKAAAAADKKGDEKKPAEEKKAAEEEKKEKDTTPAAPSYLSTRFGMWELMAAFFSHASPEQHAWLNVELKDVLLKEFEMLYGEYRERKEKQAAAAATAEKEKEAAAAAEASKEKTEEIEKDKSTAAGSPSAPRPARNPNPVPPAASLPPPPSPALRFLSSALLGEQNPEFQQISKVWNDLHNDYMYYQHKHQQKVQQEQNRLAQLQQMRQSRQLQQQRQWQQYQNQRQHGNVGQSPNRPHVPPQHQHFHQSPQGGFQQQPQQQHYQQQQQGPRGGYHHQGGYNNNNQQRQQRYNNQQPYQQGPPQSNEPPKPVPVWVKGGTSGANAVKSAPAKSSPK